MVSSNGLFMLITNMTKPMVYGLGHTAGNANCSLRKRRPGAWCRRLEMDLFLLDEFEKDLFLLVDIFYTFFYF